MLTFPGPYYLSRVSNIQYNSAFTPVRASAPNVLMLFLSLRRAPHDSEDKYADTKHGANFRVGHGEYEGGSAETCPRAITVDSLLIIIHSNSQNRKKSS
jgi:hypothetical protein